MKKSKIFSVISHMQKKNILFFLFIMPVFVFAKPGGNGMDACPKNLIHEESFIKINRVEQWVTIHGETTKPVILFLHGGPGSPISPYSKALFGDWEKDFTIVQWDQRGTGKTYGRTAPEELTPAFLQSNPLTVDQIVADGIELTAYLLKHLDKKKIILFGTSWGSVPGVKMAAKRPDLFYAYIGHSQVTDPSDDLTLYHKVFQLAEKNKDTASLDILKTLGLPPYTEAKNVGKLFRIVKKYERLNSTPAPESWFVPSAAYDNETYNRHSSDGDDYSFVNYVGDKRLGVTAMRKTINLVNDNPEFMIPVYFVQGAEDLLTPKEASRKYFNIIKAPAKKYYLLPKTAHGFNESVLAALYKICKAIKTK